MSDKKQYTLPKTERIYKNNDIEKLFSKNSSFVSYPLRVLYRIEEGHNVPQILVSVSKRNFKRANKRNCLKRLIRESYRLNKLDFLAFAEKNQISIHVAFLYIKKELSEFKEVEKALIKSLSMIVAEYENDKKDLN